MEARRRVEFTGVELAALVEKVTTGCFGEEGREAEWGVPGRWSATQQGTCVRRRVRERRGAGWGHTRGWRERMVVGLCGADGS